MKKKELSETEKRSQELKENIIYLFLYVGLLIFFLYSKDGWLKYIMLGVTSICTLLHTIFVLSLLCNDEDEKVKEEQPVKKAPRKKKAPQKALPKAEPVKLTNIIYIYKSPREEYTVRVHGLPPFDESKSYRYYNKDVELEFLRGEDKLPLSATYKVFDTEKERLVLRSEIKNEADSTERKEIVFFYEDYIKFKVGDKVISAFLDDCFK